MWLMLRRRCLKPICLLTLLCALSYFGGKLFNRTGQPSFSHNELKSICNSSEPGKRALKYITFYLRNQPHAQRLVYLSNVRSILDLHGWNEVLDPAENFSLLWSYDDPYTAWRPIIQKLQPHQQVSFIPGLEGITHKGTLSTLDLPFIPKSFYLPDQRTQLEEYMSDNPNATFVYKTKRHRGVRFADAPRLEAQENFREVFLQEFIANPLLIGGYKFDIGVYVVITSLEPLRIYVMNEVEVRFCWEKYHPLNKSNVYQYVVMPDKRRSVWEIPETSHMYLELSRKDIISARIMSSGHDPRSTWNRIDSIVAEVILKHRLPALDDFRSFSNEENLFFLIRLDFMLDDKLQTFLLEANTLIDLEAPPGSELAKLHKHVMAATLRLRGLIDVNRADPVPQPVYIFPDMCHSQNCTSKNCNEGHCSLCKECLSEVDRAFLTRAYKEHVNSGDLLHRVYPQPILRDVVPVDDANGTLLLRQDRLLRDWFEVKCQDNSLFWCQ